MEMKDRKPGNRELSQHRSACGKGAISAGKPSNRTQKRQGRARVPTIAEEEF
jgi:hypothetical protein